MLLQARHTVKVNTSRLHADCKILPHSQLSIACSMSNEKEVWEWDQASGNETSSTVTESPDGSHRLSEDDRTTPCWEWCMALPPQWLHWPVRLREMGHCSHDIIMTSWRREHLSYWHVARSPIDRGHHWPVEDSTWSDRVTQTMVFKVVYISDGFIPRPFILL